MLASAGADRTITLWHHPLGSLGKPLAQLHQAAAQVAVSPDGSVIASGGPTGQIYLIDRSTREIRVLPHRPNDQIGHLAFDPAGRTLAAGYGDGTIVLWDVASGKPVRTLRGNTGSVLSLAFDQTGSRLVSGGGDGTVRLWNIRTGGQVGAALRGGLGAVYAVAFSPDGRSVAAGGDGRAIRLWNARTGNRSARRSLKRMLCSASLSLRMGMSSHPAAPTTRSTCGGSDSVPMAG